MCVEQSCEPSEEGDIKGSQHRKTQGTGHVGPALNRMVLEGGEKSHDCKQVEAEAGLAGKLGTGCRRKRMELW